jgi:hypothetical protein
MRRDLRPLVAATVTAVVSCGLLALAISRGWLGPDVGRGANFCEAARDGLIRQPANTLSNVGFVMAGLLIAWHARLPGNVGTGLSLHRNLVTVIACLVVFLGPASAAMHATQSALGGHFDMLSMYLVASFAAAYAGMRWLRGGTLAFVALLAAGIALCEAVGLSRVRIPVVMTTGNLIFGLLLTTAVVLEVLLMRRAETTATRPYAFASLGAILVAFGIWNASRAWLCAPYSPIQGHAIWHLLGAVSAYLLYRYYASEEIRVGPGSVPEVARSVPSHS